MGLPTTDMFNSLKIKGCALAARHLLTAARKTSDPHERAELLSRSDVLLGAADVPLESLRMSQRLALQEPLRVALNALFESDAAVRQQFGSDHAVFTAFVNHAITANR